MGLNNIKIFFVFFAVFFSFCLVQAFPLQIEANGTVRDLNSSNTSNFSVSFIYQNTTYVYLNLTNININYTSVNITNVTCFNCTMVSSYNYTYYYNGTYDGYNKSTINEKLSVISDSISSFKTDYNDRLNILTERVNNISSMTRTNEDSGTHIGLWVAVIVLALFVVILFLWKIND